MHTHFSRHRDEEMSITHVFQNAMFRVSQIKTANMLGMSDSQSEPQLEMLNKNELLSEG